jgi:hypothetical protein
MMEKSSVFNQATVGSQARLILQDPRSWEEAQIPALQLSKEINISSDPQLSSAQAKQIWENLQLKTEDAVLQTERLKLATANAEIEANKNLKLQRENMQLKQQVLEQEATRWQHPAVYAAGATLLGFGLLWLHERKKRISAQENLLGMPNNFSSVLDMPEGPSVNYSESIAKSWANSIPSLPPLEPEISAEAKQPSLESEPIIDPISDAISHEDLLPYAPVQQPDPLPASASASAHTEQPVPWWKLLKRKPQASSAVTASSYEGASSYLSTQTPIFSTEIQLYDDRELHDMDAPEIDLAEGKAQSGDFYDPALANLELLTETRIKPASTDDAMGHLLEIRMAVQALCALEQPLAAQELLAKHITAVPNTCAWAYMEYLDLSAQLGQRDAFEAMRKRYRLQFNRLAPYWMEPNASVQTLDAYERPMVELSAAWGSHALAHTLISTWLLGTLHSRRLFQLPAYHDLLDLYEMLEFYDADPSLPEWVSTVSLLDLDYEFAVEVKLEAMSDREAVRVVPAVKTGDFAVDFNVTTNPTQPGALTVRPDMASLPALKNLV